MGRALSLKLQVVDEYRLRQRQKADGQCCAPLDETTNGYIRLPERECLPPIVRLITDAGTIHIEGTTLEFSHEVAPIFLEAGFLTCADIESADGIDDGGRRRLTSAALAGFFNNLADITLNATQAGTCLPTLPQMPTKMVAIEREYERCGEQCEDEYGLRVHNVAGVVELGGHPFTVVDRQVLSDTIETDDSVAERLRIVSKFARFPELRHVSLNNGTHEVQWTEYAGEKYHCDFGYGFDGETDDGAPQQTSMPQNASLNAELNEIFTPIITYDGYTWYKSDFVHEEVGSLRYKMELFAGESVTHYYATVDNPNKPMGVHAFEYNKDTYAYELTQRTDYMSTKVNDEVTDTDLPATTWEMPTPESCVRARDKRIEPPSIQPGMNNVGIGVYLAEGQGWGGLDSEEVVIPEFPNGVNGTLDATGNASGGGGRMLSYIDPNDFKDYSCGTFTKHFKDAISMGISTCPSDCDSCPSFALTGQAASKGILSLVRLDGELWASMSGGTGGTAKPAPAAGGEMNACIGGSSLLTELGIKGKFWKVFEGELLDCWLKIVQVTAQVSYSSQIDNDGKNVMINAVIRDGDPHPDTWQKMYMAAKIDFCISVRIGSVVSAKVCVGVLQVFERTGKQTAKQTGKTVESASYLRVWAKASVRKNGVGKRIKKVKDFYPSGNTKNTGELCKDNTFFVKFKGDQKPVKWKKHRGPHLHYRC